MSDSKANRFRFRAWDGSQMHSDVVPVEWHSGDQNCATFCDVNCRLVIWDDCPESIMQSAGLLDSEGVEIFEHDIVEAIWVREPDFAPDLSVVKWDRTEFYLFVLCDDMPAPCHIIDCFRITVVGNIHENPELMDAAGQQ